MTSSGFVLTIVISALAGFIFGTAFAHDYEVKLRK